MSTVAGTVVVQCTLCPAQSVHSASCASFCVVTQRQGVCVGACACTEYIKGCMYIHCTCTMGSGSSSRFQQGSSKKAESSESDVTCIYALYIHAHVVGAEVGAMVQYSGSVEIGAGAGAAEGCRAWLGSKIDFLRWLVFPVQNPCFLFDYLQKHSRG